MKIAKFSLVELLLIIGILLILGSLLQPSMKKMVGRAHQIQCSEQLKWLLSGFDQYCEDELEYPYGDTHSFGWVSWGNAPNHLTRGSLWPYIGKEDVYLCPSDETGHIRSYSVNHLVNNYRQTKPYGIDLFKTPLSSPSPTQTMVFVEEHDPRWFNMGTYVPGGWSFWIDNVAGWHNLGNNIGLMDGHVDYVEWTDDQTPHRFLERKNFRNHDDMITLLKYFTAGIVKP